MLSYSNVPTSFGAVARQSSTSAATAYRPSVSVTQTAANAGLTPEQQAAAATQRASDRKAARARAEEQVAAEGQCQSGYVPATFSTCKTPKTMATLATGQCPAGYELQNKNEGKPLPIFLNCRRLFPLDAVPATEYSSCAPAGAIEPRACTQAELTAFYSALPPAPPAEDTSQIPKVTYPAGTITAFDESIAMWRVAVPLAGFAGLGQAYVENQPVAAKPAGATVVLLEELHKLTGKAPTTPLYKKPWFWAAVGGGALVLGGGGYLLLRKKRS